MSEKASDGALQAAAEEIIKTTRTIGWKIMMEQFRRLIIDARDELETVDPDNRKRIIELQQEILCYKRLPGIAEELINQGLQIEELAESADAPGEDADGRADPDE